MIPGAEPFSGHHGHPGFIQELHALVGGADLVGATEWAVRVGAAATLRHGAQPSLPTRADIEHLLGP